MLFVYSCVLVVCPAFRRSFHQLIKIHHDACIYYHSLNIKMGDLIKILKYKLKLVKIFTNSIVCTSIIHVRKYDNMHFKSNFCVLMYNDITQNESHFANPFLFHYWEKQLALFFLKVKHFIYINLETCESTWVSLEYQYFQYISYFSIY